MEQSESLNEESLIVTARSKNERNIMAMSRLSIFPCELFPCGKFFPAIDSRRETGKKFPAGNFKNIV